MSRGGRGGGRGGRGGGGNPAMSMMPFELMGDLGSGGLFNVQTDLFPVSQLCHVTKVTLGESYSTANMVS